MAAARGLTVTPSIFFQHAHIEDADLYWEERPQFQSEAKIPQPNDDKWTLPTLTVDYALPAFSIRSISSYMSRTNLQVNDWSYIEPSQLQGGPVDVPGLPDWSAAMHARIQQDVFTQEVRFTSADSDQARLSWVGGLYFQHNHLHRVRSEFEDLDALTGAVFGAPASRSSARRRCRGRWGTRKTQPTSSRRPPHSAMCPTSSPSSSR